MEPSRIKRVLTDNVNIIIKLQILLRKKQKCFADIIKKCTFALAIKEWLISSTE